MISLSLFGPIRRTSCFLQLPPRISRRHARLARHACSSCSFNSTSGKTSGPRRSLNRSPDIAIAIETTDLGGPGWLGTGGQHIRNDRALSINQAHHCLLPTANSPKTPSLPEPIKSNRTISRGRSLVEIN